MDTKDELMDDTLREEVLTRLAQDWEASHDVATVHRIASEIPAYASEIYDLFALLIDVEDIPEESMATRARVDARVRELLIDRGYALAAAHSVPPTSPTVTPTLVQTLVAGSGKTIPETAKEMGITTSFLVGVEGNLLLLPRRARVELCARGSKVSTVPAKRLDQVIEEQAKQALSRAAKRVGSQAPALTYEQLVRGSGLEAISEHEVGFWLSLQDES